MTKNLYYISEANVDVANHITWNPELEQERKSAVFDLLNNGSFKLAKLKDTGPYKLEIKLVEWKLILKVLIYLANTNLILEHYYMPANEEIEHIPKRPPAHTHLRLRDSPLGNLD